jgi:predicted dehydrogenase
MEDQSTVTRRGFLASAGTAALTPAALAAGGLMGPRALKKLRIGVVGGGFGAAFFWHLHPDCEVTAVADLWADRRHSMRERYRTNNVYEEFHPMLKDPAVDAVAIWTAAPDHARHVLDVLNAGKHAISAVPAAMTLEDCQQLVDTVKRTGLNYMLAETSCFHSATMSARRMRMEGQFGEIYYTQGEYLHDLGDFHTGGKSSRLLKDADGKPTWRYGFPVAKYPSHANGSIIFVTGDRTASVAAIGWRLDNETYRHNAYNNPFINVTFFCKTMAGNASRIMIHHHLGAEGDIGERAEYFGTKMLFLEPRFGQPALVSHENGKLQPWPLEDHSGILPPDLRKYTAGGHGGSEAYITNEFVNACVEGRRPLIDVFEAVAYASPGICAQDSALKGGEWIKVPDFGWHS